MDSVIQTVNVSFNNDDYKFQLFGCCESESPRQWDNMGRMVCFCKEYSLGDEQPKSSPLEFLACLVGMEELIDNSETEEEVRKKIIDKIRKEYVMLSLYLYVQYDNFMKVKPLEFAFDSRTMGYLFVSVEMAKKEYSGDDWESKALNRLNAEVTVYNQYLLGEVYSYSLFKKEVCNLGHNHWTSIDERGGFYGHNILKNGLFDSIECREEIKELIRKEL